MPSQSAADSTRDIASDGHSAMATADHTVDCQPAACFVHPPGALACDQHAQPFRDRSFIGAPHDYIKVSLKPPP